MPNIGTMTVGVDAVATKAHKTFKQLGNDGIGLKKKIKDIGNVQIGPGSALAAGIGFMRQQFTAMIADVHKFQADAAAAGKTVTEFTKGMVTSQDVERATEFSKSLSKLGDVFKAGRKDLLIDVTPAATEIVQRLTVIVDSVFGFADGIQNSLISGFGSIGDRLTRDKRNETAITDLAAENARFKGNRKPSALNEFLAGRVAPLSPQARADRSEALESDRKRQDLLNKIEQNTRNQESGGGTTVEIKEARL